MSKDELKEKVIKEGKERCKGDLFLAEYTITDREGNPMELLFTYREPTTAEMKLYTDMGRKDNIEANRWLMSQMIVSSDGDVVKKIGTHYNAIGTFITEYFTPLFGTPAEIQPIKKI